MKLDLNPTLKEFNKLTNLIEEFYHEICVKQGLSDSAYAILQTFLALGNGCTQTDIYKHTVLNKQTVHSSVKKLCQDGLITLEKGNGRELKIYLTVDGEKIVRERILPIEQAENEVFNEMTMEEQEEILRLTQKYLDAYRSKVEKLGV